MTAALVSSPRSSSILKAKTKTSSSSSPTSVMMMGGPSSSSSKSSRRPRSGSGSGSARISTTAVKKQASSPTKVSPTNGSLSDAQRQQHHHHHRHHNHNGGSATAVNNMMPVSKPTMNMDKNATAGNDDDNESDDDDNNSYLLPRTLFQELPSSPRPCTSSTINYLHKEIIMAAQSRGTGPKGKSKVNEFNNHESHPKEVVAITAVMRSPSPSASSLHVKPTTSAIQTSSPTPATAAISPSSRNKANNNHQPTNDFNSVADHNNIYYDNSNNIIDDQSSITSELSNLSTPSANHRRILHNSHKLARHILQYNPATASPHETAAATSSTLTKDTTLTNLPGAGGSADSTVPTNVVTTTPTIMAGGGVPLKHDPEFTLYYRMLRYGFTLNAVRSALHKDGKLDITRLDPERPVERQKMPWGMLIPSSPAVAGGAAAKTKTAGLEVNEYGLLTDKGWEMALESAQNALLGSEDKKTKDNSRIKKSPAYRKRKEASNTDKSSSVVGKGGMEGATSMDYSNNAAVGTVPPWLLHKSTIANAEHHGSRSSSGILLEGWLHKRTRHGRWVKRWYLIDSSGIYYTHSPPPSCSKSSSPSSSSSSASKKKMKYIKLVDARSLLLCTKNNIRSSTNPKEFELLCPHPSASSASPSSPLASFVSASSRKHVLATLKASTVSEVDMWIDAIDCVCERLRLVDEVVVGSSSNGAAGTIVSKRERNSITASSQRKDVGFRSANSSTAKNATTTSCQIDTRLTTNHHPYSQPNNLLQSRDTLETLASSDDSFDVFEENCDDHHNSNINSRHHSVMMKSDCQSKLNEEFGTDLMKAVDDLTRLTSTTQGGSNNSSSSSKPSKPHLADLKQSKDDSMDVDNTAKLDGTDGDGDEPILKLDPQYQKYYAMMKMGLPKQVAQHAMKRDQLDPSILDLDPEKSLRSQKVTSKESKGGDDECLPLKDDPKYSKYFKMMKMGLPIEAAKHAMKRDQLDSSILDLDPEKSLSSQIQSSGGEDTDIGFPLKEDPKYAKYFQMMKIGLPKEVVQHSMVRDQLDPQILNMDPERSFTSQAGPSTPPSASEDGKPCPSSDQMGGLKITKGKPTLRRKKVYWNKVDAREGNIWSVLKKLEPTLKHDPTEFERLFSQSIDAEREKEQNEISRSTTSSTAKNVKVIDSKRGMNGDIILRKLKLEPAQVASMVENLDCSLLDSIELRTLYEFMPTEEESKSLTVYLDDSKSRDDAFLNLTPCEQFMVAMKDLKDGERKFQSMIFISEFQGKMAELKWDVGHLSAACEELRMSKRFQMLLAMILRLVNKINSGGDDDAVIACGFSLDLLSKLGETKGFDNKTTVLHYLVKVVRESNTDILKFQEEIKSVVLAKKVVMERLLSSVKQLCEESRIVTETAAEYGEEYRKSLNDPHQKDKFSNMKSQRESVKEIRHLVTFLSEKEVPPGKINSTHCERFSVFSKLELQKALGVIKEANQKYIRLLEYFGEDMKSPQAFFGMIDQFMERFDQAADLIETEEQASQKSARQALAKEAKLRVKSALNCASDGGNFVNARMEGDDNDLLSGDNLLPILSGPTPSDKDYPDMSPECHDKDKIAAAASTAQPLALNNARRTVETTPVPNEAEGTGGDGISRRTASFAWKTNQNTATDTQLCTGGVEGDKPAMSTAATRENVDQGQSSMKRSPKSSIPTQTGGITKVSTMAARRQKLLACHPNELPLSSPNFGSVSIADMAVAAARRRSDPSKSNTEAESTPTGHSLGINVTAMVDAAAHQTEGMGQEEVGADGRGCSVSDANTRQQKYLTSFQKKQQLRQERPRKKNIGRVEQVKLALEEARQQKQEQGKAHISNSESPKHVGLPNITVRKPWPPLAAHPPGLGKEQSDGTKTTSTSSLGGEPTCMQTSAAETPQPSQAHPCYSEVAVSTVDEKEERRQLQAENRPVQSTNIAALIALREAARPGMNSATITFSSEHRKEVGHRIARKSNEDETLTSAASPPAMNIAAMAAEVARKKKEKQRSEQTQTVEPGDGTKIWDSAEQRKEVEARSLLVETEVLQRRFVGGEGTSTKIRSSSSNQHHAEYNTRFPTAPCQNPPRQAGPQKAQTNQGKLLAAVSHVAIQKSQRTVADRKPSKLSLAVAAAAQQRPSSNAVPCQHSKVRSSQ